MVEKCHESSNQIRRFWNFASCDDIRKIEGKRIFRDTQDRKDLVARLGDLSEQTGTRIPALSLLGRVRAKIAWILSREYGIPVAEIENFGVKNFG